MERIKDTKKDSFILYTNFYQPIKGLSDEQIGRLFRAIFLYNSEGATEVDQDIYIPWQFFLNQFKVNEDNYRKKCDKNRKNITEYWDKVKSGTNERIRSNSDEYDGYLNDSDSDSDSVSDSDSDSKNDNDSLNTGDKSPAPKKDYSFIDSIIREFRTNFHDSRGFEYEITNKGKERSAAGWLAKKYREQYPEATTEEALQGMSAYFKACLEIKDKFLYNKMSIPLVRSEWNSIKTILTHGTDKRIGKNGATDKDCFDLLTKHFATDNKNG